jgi:tRNA threonylcarbamoyladenosine modification (KEOPS) complex Cgi121 subunit
MSIPLIAYVATGGQRDFDVPFPYLSTSHVEVRVNGSLISVLEWVSQSRVRLATPPGAGATVELRRNTPISTAMVDFENGAVLTEEDLNTAVQQLLYKQQEITAFYEASLQKAFVRIAEAGGIVVDPEDVANQIANLVLEEDVLANFQQRINDIDNNAALTALLSGTLDQTNQAIADPLTGNSALSTALGVLRSDHESLAGVVDGLLDLGNGEGISTVIQNETDARVAGDNALAATIALIGAKSGDSLSFILDLTKVKVSPTESLGTRLTTIASSIADNSAAITNESSTRASAISAEATARQQLGAALQTAINNEAATRSAAITTEQNARATAIAAEATARQQLNTSLTNAINGESSTRAAAIIAEQNARSTAISAEATARQSLAAALTSDIEGLEGQIASVSSQVSSEITARVNGDNALASTISLIGAKNGAGNAFILNESTVQLTGGVSLGTRLSGIDTNIGNVSASVVNEQNARASADTALSNNINVVSTNVGTLSATVSTISSSVNGLQAKYGVSLDVNGYVTGFIQNNNGSTGSFDILADKFRVVIPGQAPLQVFQADAGGVKINGNLIVSGSITATSLAVGAVTTTAISTGAVTTPALPQNAVSNSAYWQTSYGGLMSYYTLNVWTDFNPSTSGGSGGVGGGSGGGGEFEN